jgi:hypothetical protein
MCYVPAFARAKRNRNKQIWPVWNSARKRARASQMLLAGAGTPANHASVANPIQRPWPSTRYPYDSACRPITRGFHHEGTKFTKKKDRVRWGIWGG